eukprot:Nk52_evm6s288 gene=Nk52_evmTU6s288
MPYGTDVIIGELIHPRAARPSTSYTEAYCSGNAPHKVLEKRFPPIQKTFNSFEIAAEKRKEATLAAKCEQSGDDYKYPLCQGIGTNIRAPYVYERIDRLSGEACDTVAKKEVQPAPKPQEEKPKEDPKLSKLKEKNRLIYTSSTHRAYEEVGYLRPLPTKPISLKEMTPKDYLKHGKTIEPLEQGRPGIEPLSSRQAQAEIWQRVGAQWDRAQRRPLTNKSSLSTNMAFTGVGRLDGKLPGYAGYIKNREKEAPTWPYTDSNCPKFSTPLQEYKAVGGDSADPNLPGYTGFKPKSSYNAAYMMYARYNRGNSSCMSRDFINPSVNILKEHVNEPTHHQGAFSKKVTLTHPFNPYNKIDTHAKYYNPFYSK